MRESEADTISYINYNDIQLPFNKFFYHPTTLPLTPPHFHFSQNFDSWPFLPSRDALYITSTNSSFNTIMKYIDYHI